MKSYTCCPVRATHLRHRSVESRWRHAHLIAAAIALTLSTLGMPTTGATSAGSIQQAPTPEQIARHREAAQPGPEHALLAALEGTWEQTVRIWPEPGAEATTSTAAATGEMVLGGRFLVQRSDATGIASMTILGFDRRSEEMTLVGFDTVGTYSVSARGKLDESGRRAVLSGEDRDPILEHTQEYDFVLTWHDDGSFTTEIVFKDELHTRGGDPFTMVEVVARKSQ